MHTLTLTVRGAAGGARVVADESYPGLASGPNVEEPLLLELLVPSVLLQFPPSMGGLRQYGEKLGEAVFHGRVRDVFGRAQSRADAAKEPLHVLLSVEDERFKALKWERLCSPFAGGWEFLRLQQSTPYSFYLPSAVDRRYPAISRADLRALVVVADFGPERPYGLAEFDAQETVKGLRDALGEIPCCVLACDAKGVLPGADGPPTLGEICRRITAERFPILHIVCHGKYFKAEGEKPGETMLFLRQENPASPMKDGGVTRVSDTELLSGLRTLYGAQTLPHFTFLCSCESASPDAEQALGGLGQRLVQELGMPAVLAMTAPVPIPIAQRLAAQFYRRLRASGAVDLALDQACAGEAKLGQVLIPVLFSRLGGRRLFDQTGPLTVGEWEHGLKALPALVSERAPTLRERLDGHVRRGRPALDVWKGTEGSTEESEETRWARSELATLQADLNDLCQDVLESSFDALAKGTPLRFPNYDARCPFPGLGVFDKTGEEDFRPFFFGREQLTSELRRLLDEHRFVAVLGGSGSGKSSLVRAGLLGALGRANPNLRQIVFPPGKDPRDRLRAELATVPAPGIIVVDQFEEVFTHCADPEQRAAFLRELLRLRDQVPVVITMRADFLGECAEHDELHGLLDAEQKHLKLIQPLRGDELRNVMERQAEAVGLRFEPGLASQIFTDIEGEPGAMPLLQHCLRQLWHRRHGRWLRLAEYISEEGIGGVRGAISRTAEDVFLGLADTKQKLLPYMFEQLVRIDTDATAPEQRRDTRRRVDIGELTPAGGDTKIAQKLVNQLADAKLLIITTRLGKPDAPAEASDVTEVEVAHEALIRHWTRLQGWLNAARDTARLVERIRTDTANYTLQPTADNLTLRGVVLVEAEKLLAEKTLKLSEKQATYVVACKDLQRTEQQQELEQAKALAESRRRTNRVFRYALVVAGVLFLGAAVAAVIAYDQRGEARSQKKDADKQRDKAKEQKKEADAQRDLAQTTARIVRARSYILSMNAAQRAWDDNDIGRLDELLAAQQPERTNGEDYRGFEWYYWRKVRTANSHTFAWPSFPAMSIGPSPTGEYRGFPTPCLAFDASATRLAASEGETLCVWNLATGVEELALNGQAGDIRGLAFDPATTHLTTVAADGVVRVWNVVAGGTPVPVRTVQLNHRFTDAVAISADGKRLATASSPKYRSVKKSSGESAEIDSKPYTVVVRDPQTGEDRRELDYTVRVWDRETGRELIPPLKEHTSFVTRLAFSPDGTHLASGGSDNKILLWDLTGKEKPRSQPTRGFVLGMVFSPNGEQLAVAMRGEDVVLWQCGTEKNKGASRVPGTAGWQTSSLAFSAEGEWLVVGSAGGPVRAWNVKTQEVVVLRAHNPAIRGVERVTASPQGVPRLASWGNDGTVRVWNLETARLPRTRSEFSADAVNLTSDGSRVVGTAAGGVVRVWDLAVGGEPVTLKGQQGGVNTSYIISFSSDSRCVAAADDGEVRVWDLLTGVEPLNLKVGPGVVCHAIGPMGAFLAVAKRDRTARVIDLVTRGERRLGTPISPPESGLIVGLAFSPAGDSLAALGLDGAVRVWNLTTGAERFLPMERVKAGVPQPVSSCVVFSSDGTRLAAGGSDGTVRVWDLRTGGDPRLLKGLTTSVVSLGFNPDGSRLVAVPARSNSPQTVRIWDVATGELTLTLKPPSGDLRAIAFRRDGKALIGVTSALHGGSTTGGETWTTPGAAYIWDVAD